MLEFLLKKLSESDKALVFIFKRKFENGKFIEAPNASKALAKGDFKTALKELFSKEKGITKSKDPNTGRNIYNPGIYKRSIALLGLAEHGINK